MHTACAAAQKRVLPIGSIERVLVELKNERVLKELVKGEAESGKSLNSELQAGVLTQESVTQSSRC